jgi:tripartite-type tricarboxylate transporter receptor subunit TctC
VTKTTVLVGFVLAVLAPCAVMAQEKYPERPIRLLSPFAPGASTDAAARRFAIALTPLIGQSVYVDNRAGGAGSIAAAEVARAKPDGYTLIFGTVSTHVLNVLTMKNVSYDPLKDFANIALLGTNTSSLAVHPTIAGTLPELIQRVKSMPGKFSYGSSGQGSILHLAGELFKQQAGGLDMVHVPYRGSGNSVVDVISGEVPMGVMALGTAIPHHRAGKLRALAAFSETRSKVAPDIPTAIEQGVPKMVSYSCVLLAAPAGTPKPVVEQLYQATTKVVNDASFQKDLLVIGFDPVTDSDPQKATQFIRDELAKWGPIAKMTGLAP